MKHLIEKSYSNYLRDIEYIFGGREVTYSDHLAAVGTTLFGSRFLGVFAHDRVPRLQHGEMCIANLDDHDQEGSHWVGLAGNLCYDSFGRGDIGFEEYDQTEEDAEQAIFENNCGQRSLAFLCVFYVFGKDSAWYV